MLLVSHLEIFCKCLDEMIATVLIGLCASWDYVCHLHSSMVSFLALSILLIVSDRALSWFLCIYPELGVAVDF